MGGFASQVQAPQTSQPRSGFGGKIGNMADQVTSQAPARPDGLDQNAINANPQGFQQWQQQRDQQQMNVVPQGGGDGMGGTGMGYGAPRPMGKGGVQTNSATSGQPRMGQQNQYSNTVGQWDNTQIQPVRQQGKGKGA
jgi:hypothetical protein